MEMKVSVSGIAETMAQLRKQISEKEAQKLISISSDLVDALKAATPVDTGFARDSWGVEIKDGKAVIKNTAPYIDELNQGHSKQAPTHFIEKTVLENKDVVPNGAIVSYS